MQESQEITTTALAEAEKIAGLVFTDEERKAMVRGPNQNLETYRELGAHPIPNDVPPAMRFDPVLPSMELPTEVRSFRPSRAPSLRVPENLEEVAFWPVTQLSELVRSRQVTSMALTRMYLDRLKRHGPTLECVVTLRPG